MFSIKIKLKVYGRRILIKVLRGMLNQNDDRVGHSLTPHLYRFLTKNKES